MGNCNFPAVRLLYSQPLIVTCSLMWFGRSLMRTAIMKARDYTVAARGTFTNNDLGTIVITSGGGMLNTSPSMPRCRCLRDDWTLTRAVWNDRKPGAVFTRPAK